MRNYNQWLWCDQPNSQELVHYYVNIFILRFWTKNIHPIIYGHENYKLLFRKEQKISNSKPFDHWTIYTNNFNQFEIITNYLVFSKKKKEKRRELIILLLTMNTYEKLLLDLNYTKQLERKEPN